MLFILEAQRSDRDRGAAAGCGGEVGAQSESLPLRVDPEVNPCR